MADIDPEIEVLENRLMRAWVDRDAATLKRLLASDFLCMFATSPPELLDRPSFVAAISQGLVCEGFRLAPLATRAHGRSLWFTADCELDLKLGPREWKGRFLVTDLWRKPRFRRDWKMAERSLAPLAREERHTAAIRALQLWH